MSKAHLKANRGSVLIRVSYDGDYLAELRVNSYDFKGSSGGHVVEETFCKFLTDLESLERNRRGRAVLEPVTPDFSLVIEQADMLGHMKVTGFVRGYDWSENSDHVNELRFSFEFDPPALNSLIEGVRVCVATKD